MTLTLAFLQARMGSSRLPGKVLMPIWGKTILERAVERLRAARRLDGVVILTTVLDEDHAIVEQGGRLGTEVFRGPGMDVLGRFRQASDRFRPDFIVRATADNPLIDIGSVDRIVRRLQTNSLDYCMEEDLPVGAATEAITRFALERVDRLGRQPHHREHVTVYVKEHRGDFRTDFPLPPEALRRPDLRLTVDTPGDFARVTALIGSIPDTGVPIPLAEYLDLMRPVSACQVPGPELHDGLCLESAAPSEARAVLPHRRQPRGCAS